MHRHRHYIVRMTNAIHNNNNNSNREWDVGMKETVNVHNDIYTRAQHSTYTNTYSLHSAHSTH